MDTKQQEEVKPRFSQTDKIKIVNEFLLSDYSVGNWQEMVDLINSQEIQPLKHLELTYDGSRGYLSQATAKDYFNFLARLVLAGGKPEESSMLMQAYNQLFVFIIALRDETEITGQNDLLTRQTLESTLAHYGARVNELSQLVRSRDREIASMSKGFKELIERINELGEDLKTVTSSVQQLEAAIRGLDYSTEKGLSNVKTILEGIRNWIGTYKEPLEWVKKEHDSVHPVTANEKKPK